MKKLLFIPIALIVVSGVFMSRADITHACSYITVTPEEKFSKADAVFYGKVTKADTTVSPGQSNSELSSSVTSLDVSKYWKGNVGKTMKVESSHVVGYSCGSFKGQVGTNYLVYATYSTTTGQFHTSEVGPISGVYADNVLMSLGEGKIPTDIQTPPPQPPANKFMFTRNLSQGMSGEDVRQLQKYLNGQGIMVALSGSGSLSNETSYFGPATKAALLRFQSDHAAELGITVGTGYFGVLTRAMVNK